MDIKGERSPVNNKGVQMKIKKGKKDSQRNSGKVIKLEVGGEWRLSNYKLKVEISMGGFD